MGKSKKGARGGKVKLREREEKTGKRRYKWGKSLCSSRFEIPFGKFPGNRQWALIKISGFGSPAVALREPCFVCRNWGQEHCGILMHV